jgi:hypothetical protein
MTNGESEPSGAIPVGYYALRLLDEISSWLAASRPEVFRQYILRCFTKLF